MSALIPRAFQNDVQGKVQSSRTLHHSLKHLEISNGTGGRAQAVEGAVGVDGRNEEVAKELGNFACGVVARGGEKWYKLDSAL